MLRLKIILQSNYLYVVFLLLVIILAFFRLNRSESKYNPDETEFRGIITSYSIDGDKLSFEFKGKEKLKGVYYLSSEEEKKNYENMDLGKNILITGSLTLPLNNVIPNTFNYRAYLKNNNIHYLLNVEKIEVINNKPNIFYRIKNSIIKHIRNYKSKDYLYAFIIGDKSYMAEETKDNYQSLGVSHIFAISGMHISLLSGLFLKILNKLKVSLKSSYICVITFLIFYLFITSFQASILRSVGLFILNFLNKEFDLDISLKNILYLDITILLLCNPFLLCNIGFLYSSVVSWSLISYSHLLKGNYFVSIFKVSLIAFLFSLPITILNNYEFNLLSVINNIVIVPFVSLFLYPLSLITFIFPMFDNFLYSSACLLEILSTKLLVFNVIMPKVNWLFICLYYGLLLGFFKSYKKTFLCLLGCLILITKYLNYFDPAYYVYFLDVSQGDSIIIKKGRETVMIDTGGKVSYQTEEWKKKKEYYYTDNTISFLKSIGVNKINHLIISHGDYDHMGEAIYLVQNFKVNDVILNCGTYNDLEKEFIKNLDKKNIQYSSCIKMLDINNYKLEFLKTKEYDNENDNSNVIYTKLNNYEFLFMGDASIKVEKEIIDKYSLSHIDVLKLGHHGSKTSSGEQFIDSITPKYGIISVGKNNRYGHPNDEVLENLEKSKIFRTDQDGSIMFKIYKNNLEINTCPP